MTKELIEDRESEIDFEVKKLNDYKEKRFGVNGDWIAQELLLIKPIQDQVLNVVQSIAKQKNLIKFLINLLTQLCFIPKKNTILAT